MAKWFVTIEGREQGPLSAAELKRAVAKGRVTAETPVRKEGVDSRVPAAQVKGLFAAAKDKTAKLTPPLKKDETETTSDDGEELKLAETNWPPPVATPSNVPQQPPAAQAKKKKKPATFSIRALPRGLANILILLVLATLFYLAGGLQGLALAMLIVYLFGPVFIVILVNDFKIKNADHALYIECGGLVGFVLIATLFCWLIPGDNDLTSTTLFFWTPQLAYYYILRAPRRSSSKPPVAKTRGWVDPIKEPPAPRTPGLATNRRRPTSSEGSLARRLEWAVSFSPVQSCFTCWGFCFFLSSARAMAISCQLTTMRCRCWRFYYLLRLLLLSR